MRFLQDPTKNRKYFKRGELLAKEQEEYLKKYGPQIQEPEVQEESQEVKNERGLLQWDIFVSVSFLHLYN